MPASRPAVPLLCVSKLISAGASYSEALASARAESSRLHPSAADTRLSRTESTPLPASARPPLPVSGAAGPPLPSARGSRRRSTTSAVGGQGVSLPSPLSARGSPAPRNYSDAELADLSDEAGALTLLVEGQLSLSDSAAAACNKSFETSAEVSSQGAPRSLCRRPCQSRDLCHPCRGCGEPLTDIGGPLIVWKAGNIIRRFHLDCAARAQASAALPLASRLLADDVQELERSTCSSPDYYAKAWRRSRLSDTSIQRSWERQQARESAAALRRPRPASPGLHLAGRAGARAAAQERRDGQHVADWQRQLRALRAFTKSLRGLPRDKMMDECAICLDVSQGTPRTCGSCAAKRFGSQSTGVLVLPCEGNHTFHERCLEPWLRKSFCCPLCRADLRPLLHPYGYA